MVERGHQMRRRAAPGAGTADGLAVDRDHPTAPDPPSAGPCVQSELTVQRGGVEPGEELAQVRLLRRGIQSEAGQRLHPERSGPLPDRGERPRAGKHRADRDREQTSQRVADPTRITRIGHPRQMLQKTLLRRGGHGCRRDRRR